MWLKARASRARGGRCQFTLIPNILIHFDHDHDGDHDHDDDHDDYHDDIDGDDADEVEIGNLPSRQICRYSRQRKTCLIIFL